MIEEKIPRFQRDILPVLECRGQVAAVAGLGPGRTFAAQAGKRALHIIVTPVE